MSFQKRGIVLVISGPSGVGKDAIMDIITTQSDFVKLPTCTTRPKRPGEIENVHYRFLNEKEFFALQRQEKFLDHIVISDYHYGLPLEDVFEALDRGKKIILHLVVGSAFLLKHIVPGAVLVFVMPPSQEELIQRLQSRGMSEEEIIVRLRDDPTPLQTAPYYDFVVVNHDGEEYETAGRILEFVEKLQRKRKSRLTSLIRPRILKNVTPRFFATKNLNKLREVNEILGRELHQISVELLEPQGLDIVEVVKEKARYAFHKTGKFVLVEDTGLEFDSWNGLPGALIRWFLEAVGNEGILKMLKGEKNRQATAKTAVGFYDGTKCHVFVGKIRGEILPEIRGQSGFGWDPIFVPEGHSKSFGEMTAEEKNEISMRRFALLRLKTFFEKG